MARKRGTIRERSPGKFLVRVFVGRINGKRKYISEIVEGTLTDAKHKRTELLFKVDKGELVQASGTTVEGFVSSWIDAKDIQETTRIGYTQRMENDIYPTFGKAELEDLKPHELRKHFKDLQGAPRNLSKRTVQYTHMILRQALDQAKQDKLITDNPMDGVDRPSVKRQDKVQKIQPFSKDEMKTFLEHRKQMEDPRYTLWLFQLTTGLRPSETFALTWDNVDLEAGSVRVVQAMSKIGNNKYEVGGVKSDSSLRTVPLTPTTSRALEEHSGALKRDQMVAGYRTELVFPNRVGNHLDISRIRRKWKTACRLAGVPKIRLYDCRHTFATRLLEAGVNPKAAATIMGHSSTHMFLDVYSHLTEQASEALTEEVAAAVGF